ncbi:hypothetical protein PoB_004508700 [Plakobranchus ocellatus]|uniref:Uncharacterized protein n=1 Tax=Plakobranchus ocellatus TaxID=259542 RepID=A0AAV4BH42_9GAST|nr:hypothetical protein PoB_004508700 [Plakobranchus ocellatus]
MSQLLCATHRQVSLILFCQPLRNQHSSVVCNKCTREATSLFTRFTLPCSSCPVALRLQGVLGLAFRSAVPFTSFVKPAFRVYKRQAKRELALQERFTLALQERSAASAMGVKNG